MAWIRYSLLLLIFAVFCSPHLNSQTRPAYGIVANYNFNFFTADFRSFPNVPSCCPMYQDGSGSGLAFGLMYETPLTENMRLGFRAGYSSRNGTLTRTENTVVTGNIPGVFEHRVDASLADLGLEPLFQYNPIASFWVNLGGRVGYVQKSAFSQKESLISPSNGVFPNGSSTRNEFNNIAIPDASNVFAAVLGGVSYDLPLNAKSTLFLSPEILYSLGLTPVVSGVKWSSNSLRVGISIKYSPIPKKDQIKRYEKKQVIDTIRFETIVDAPIIKYGKQEFSTVTEETEDEIIITDIAHRTDTLLFSKDIQLETPGTSPLGKLKNNTIISSVYASGLTPDSVETPKVKIEAEEFSSLLMTPLLNYIFFDENSSSIPSRYKSLRKDDVDSFDVDRNNDANHLVTYYQILNIVGKRMLKYPDAKITLIGCNSNSGSEERNLALSKQRAEAVKEYLKGTWGVPESRIKIEARNLPEKAAMSQTEDGYKENRRVEIISNNTAITAPVITKDIYRTATPPIVRFRPKVASDNPPASWTLVAEQDGNILKRFEGKGAVPSVIDWNIGKDESSHPTSDKIIKYTLSVTGESGKTVVSESTIPVEHTTVFKKKLERRDDKEIDRYSLILFDIRSSEINAINKPIISFIKSNINPNSSIKIAGYTDRSGDIRLNQALSEKRAQATADALGVKNPITIVTNSSNTFNYDVELPEGRLYTRIVDVVVETPVK